MSETKADPIKSLNETLDKIKGAIDKSIIAPINSLNSLTTSIADIPSKFQNIADAFKNLNADGNVSLSELSGAFGAVGENIDGLKQSFDNIKSAMSVLKTPAGALVAAFAYLYTTNDEFRESINNLVKVIITALKPILDSVKTLFSQVGTTVADLAGKIVSKLVPIINMLIPIIQQVLEAIVPVITTFIDAACSVLPKLVDAILPVVDVLLKMVMDILPPLLEAFLPVVDVILKMITEVLPPLLDAFMPVIEMLLEMIAEILPPLLEAFIPIVNVLMEIIKDVLPVLCKAFTPLMDIFMTLMDVLLPVLTPLIKTVADMFSGALGTAVTKIAGTLEKVLMPVLNMIKLAIEFFCKLFQGDFKGALESAKGYFLTFANGVIRMFATVVQTIIDGVAGFVNMFIKGINAVIKLVNKVPGVNIGLIGEVDWSGATSGWKIPDSIMPAMATGGVVSSPTMALVGEGRYPEAVVPLGSSPQFASMKNDIASAVMQGISGLIGGNTRGANAPIELVLSIDGDKFARTIIPAIDRENRRKGMAMQVRSV